MINLAHGISRHDRAMRRGEWQPHRGVDTLGFDMRVIAHKPYPVMEFVAEHRIELMRLDEVFAQSDFVTLHLPALPETERIVDAAKLTLMKPPPS
jgi:phosphoglycerate dehydrogenase-like enzyme